MHGGRRPATWASDEAPAAGGDPAGRLYRREPHRLLAYLTAADPSALDALEAELAALLAAAAATVTARQASPGPAAPARWVAATVPPVAVAGLRRTLAGFVARVGPEGAWVQLAEPHGVGHGAAPHPGGSRVGRRGR